MGLSHTQVWSRLHSWVFVKAIKEIIKNFSAHPAAWPHTWWGCFCFCSLWYFELPLVLLVLGSLSSVCWSLLFALLMPTFSLALAVIYTSLSPDQKSACLALIDSPFIQALLLGNEQLSLWSSHYQHICWYMMSLKMDTPKNWSYYPECSVPSKQSWGAAVASSVHNLKVFK